jgi:beta-mannosidase
MNAGLIPDPFYEENEKKLSWIHESDWNYVNYFELPVEINPERPLTLVCEGLDTIAKIYLNDKLLGKTENMFREYHFPVKEIIKAKKNKLTICFYSPVRIGRKMEMKYGKLPVALASERAYLRKAQYSFGWDWGPTFPTMGIWRPVYLVIQKPVSIHNVRFHTLAITKKEAEVRIDLDLSGKTGKYSVDIHLKNGKQSQRTTSELYKKKHAKIRFSVKNPRLWWPNGVGVPSLYELTIALKNTKDELLDKKNLNVGIRTISLELQDAEKAVFRFLVNGRRIFAKGANWIPADSFLTRIENKTYYDLLNLAKDAHMNMIRVWGGGIYERDDFYDYCDQLGLMVWQDFMFACGVYPSHREFIKNVREEFIQNINRLQYHPSLALWCGNNENDWGWYVQTKKPLKQMPDYNIYHQILPNILKRLDPLKPYWPSSPSGKDEDPNSSHSGNRHNWDIWSGWEDYTEVHKDKSLFISEFGFQGPANQKTLEKVIPNAERYPQSPLVEFHNKQVEGTERIFRFLAGHLPIQNNWEDFIYLTQLNQGLALKYCIEHWRLRWPGTAGTIIWQLNDCWPVVSWSLIDSKLFPKMAYYHVKQVYSPAFVGFHNYNNRLEIVGHHTAPGDFKGHLQINRWNFVNGKIYETKLIPLNLSSNKLKKLYLVHDTRSDKIKGEIFVISLLDDNGDPIHRNFFLTQRWKHLQLPAANIKLKITKNACYLMTNQPAFFVDLNHPEFNFSERGFILLPKEQKKLSFTGKLGGRIDPADIKIFKLNDYLSG